MVPEASAQHPAMSERERNRKCLLRLLPEYPDTGRDRKASALPWARKPEITCFLAQGSGRSCSIMTGVGKL